MLQRHKECMHSWCCVARITPDHGDRADQQQHSSHHSQQRNAGFGSAAAVAAPARGATALEAQRKQRCQITSGPPLPMHAGELGHHAACGRHQCAFALSIWSCHGSRDSSSCSPSCRLTGLCAHVISPGRVAHSRLLDMSDAVGSRPCTNPHIRTMIGPPRSGSSASANSSHGEAHLDCSSMQFVCSPSGLLIRHSLRLHVKTNAEALRIVVLCALCSIGIDMAVVWYICSPPFSICRALHTLFNIRAACSCLTESLNTNQSTTGYGLQIVT
jgi:hypothetical protein